MTRSAPALTEAQSRCLSALVALLCELFLVLCDASELPQTLRCLIESHITALKTQAAALCATAEPAPANPATHAAAPQPRPNRSTSPQPAPRAANPPAPPASLAPTPPARTSRKSRARTTAFARLKRYDIET
ncbi:hypothetical protein [Acidiphilium sp.]|uniref:hypothetical protein n=1 Tax=Acidiphilium sp. TaxID=527 RepID=UPI003D031AF7